ncbi:4a-hydroxytetrahydrobiopterin dehydratase [Xylophilus sp.]|uniref:4a-hydroxytetrahydrobiopterin dehydratase n=1 Tax=Xylophilus sp. TaxID=2653893 RepID=UPI0013BAF8DA|nr:4a-hydroxytetrahydrobiopterin dehydratase [Xylophilus sp.]KAF1046084.1 MAG: putative pterin-4-alpha-carbinolamine dehydratase [Xylophilus sp.]
MTTASRPASDLHTTDWSAQPARRALNATEIVGQLAQRSGWTLAGDGADVAIEKTFRFADYFETIAFVNAVALVAHRLDHHPDLSVHYNRAVVRWNTHDAGGLTATDFDAAGRVDALLS